MKNKWNIVFYFLLVTFVIFVIAFATPVVGVYNAKNLFSDYLGCSISAFSKSECLGFGVDIGNRIRMYGAPFIGVLATPLPFIIVFWEVSVLWLLLIIFSKTMAYKYGNLRSKK